MSGSGAYFYGETIIFGILETGKIAETIAKMWTMRHSEG